MFYTEGNKFQCIWCQVGCSYYICAQWSMPDKYFYFYGLPLSRKTRKTNTEGTSVVLLDLRQYYEKSSLAVHVIGIPGYRIEDLSS
jgi:outer membrane receptor for monomeric catechols